jgi:hypothetical protein
LDIDKVDDQITTLVEMNSLPDGAFISVAVDAMAMSPDRSHLPGKTADDSFVIYGQPLDRQFRCLPLHVITGDFGQATEKVRAAMEAVCNGVSRPGFVVKRLCTDGYPGYHAAHRKFFGEWYPRFLDGGLPAALDYASQ